MSGQSLVIETLKEGALGFDLDQQLTPSLAKQFFEHGYQFAVRYVRRTPRHAYDLTFDEVTDILQAGLGLMIVQHVAPDGWLPGKELGHLYGQIAAEETLKLKIPARTMLWCDLEGVSVIAKPQEVVDYCNAWYAQVKMAGFTPGLYVGYRPGLSGADLYYKLRFQHYWGAYNLNEDEIPVKRGICMKQRAARDIDRIPGVTQDGFDVDVALKDHFGSLPMVLVKRPTK
jgi:hypothetical protein